MEPHTRHAQKSVRHSYSLCDGEKEYIQQRKHIVKDALKELGIHTGNEVPHIALLASGGGQRSAVGMVGSLYQLAQDGLLDTMLYLASVSGSTWSMAPIYRDPRWSRNMDKTVSSFVSGTVKLEQVITWLSEKVHREDFSLTEVWGVMTAAGIMRQWDTRKFSEEAARDATNPYPIYCAVERYSFNHGPTQAKWFELSPHEVGFPELGLFVETSLLGSTFKGGHLIQKEPEMDMIQLQGILGSALGDEGSVEQFMPDWLKGQSGGGAEQYMRSYNILTKFITLAKSHITDPATVAHIDNLQKMLEEKVKQNGSVALESKSPEETVDQFQEWTTELLMVVHDWTQTLPDSPQKTLVSLLAAKLIPLIQKWEWGTVKNFLYDYEGAPIPKYLHSEETFNLIDGGLFINVATASFLGEKRDIDLIIAPEYSAGVMFSNLTLARAYAAEVKKPFPELDDVVLEAEKDWPKDCYVLEGNNAPTIVFMPLFNRNNTKDAKEWKQKMEQFATFQQGFSPDMVEYVLETAKTNMKNNKKILLREINKALQRRNKRYSKT